MRPESDLGPLVYLYRGRQIGRGDMLTLFLPFTVAILAPLIYGLWRAYSSAVHYGPLAASDWSRPWFILAGLAFALFLLVLAYRLYLARRFVAVHKGGLHLNMPAGRGMNLLQPFKLTWGEIAGIATDATREQFLGLPTRQRLRAVLYPNVGKPVRLDDSLQNLPELISRIKASLYPRLLPSLRAGFEAGQWLYFGEVAIQRQGLRTGRATSSNHPTAIPWSHIQSISIQSGYLMVEFKEYSTLPGVQQILVSRIPNLELLLQLVQQGVTT
jgi:hypothetical protein